MQTLRRRTALLTLPVAALALAGCDDDPAAPTPAVAFETSFENGLAGFTVDTDDLGDPPVTWSVDRTTDVANDGQASVAISIDNVNDQAKVWIEREVTGLAPNTTYAVDVLFDFGTSDWGTVNLWTLYADVDADDQDTWSDFDDAFTTDTGNGADEDVGVVWREEAASLFADTDGEGRLHLAIGVWGTFEVNRTYFIDDVAVRVSDPIPSG